MCERMSESMCEQSSEGDLEPGVNVPDVDIEILNEAHIPPIASTDFQVESERAFNDGTLA